MPARRVSDLRARKELLLAEADLHRQLLVLERLRWRRHGATARQFLDGKRGWLLGCAAIMGAVLARRWSGLAKWLPTALATARALLG